jgi:hypothetical protein
MPFKMNSSSLIFITFLVGFNRFSGYNELPSDLKSFQCAETPLQFYSFCMLVLDLMILNEKCVLLYRTGT